MEQRKEKQNTADQRQSRRGGRTGRRTGKREVDKKKALFVFAVCFFFFVVFFLIRNTYFYFTESGIDPQTPYPVKGVDISAHQADVDWQGLEKEGIRFAFVKATEGTTFVDSLFAHNWEEAHKTDMKVGAYHFLTYTTPGKTQAQNYIDTVNKKWGMLPPVVDVELYGEYEDNHPSRKEMYEILDVVLEMLEKEYHRTPIIYTNLSVYEQYISGRYDEYPIWISSPDAIPETLPDDREWLFCQYTFTRTSASVGNHAKHVDYNVFNGSEWDFRKYDGK